ncbi:MAG: hypothetical protein ACREOI_29765 [bacterium]
MMKQRWRPVNLRVKFAEFKMELQISELNAREISHDLGQALTLTSALSLRSQQQGKNGQQPDQI